METYEAILERMRAEYEKKSGSPPEDASDLGLRLQILAGELYRPIRYPASFRTVDIYASVEPLPLVPAIWINFKSFWGFPSLRSISRIQSSPGRKP